jgi:hypothetical protein
VWVPWPLPSVSSLSAVLVPHSARPSWGLSRISSKKSGATDYVYDSTAGEGIVIYGVDTGTTEAFFATPNLLPAAVDAVWVPWPLPSVSSLSAVLMLLHGASLASLARGPVLPTMCMTLLLVRAS